MTLWHSDGDAYRKDPHCKVRMWEPGKTHFVRLLLKTHFVIKVRVTGIPGLLTPPADPLRGVIIGNHG